MSSSSSSSACFTAPNGRELKTDKRRKGALTEELGAEEAGTATDTETL